MIFLKKLLFEYKELLNRNIYGEWITNTNEIIPVLGAHGIVLSKHYGPPYASFYELYERAISEGWVRVVHPTPNDLGFEGTRKAVKRVLKIIRPSISQRDIETVKFTILSDTNPEKYIKSESFVIPKERSRLIDFMNSL
jgi:hypothetical protein